LTINWVLYVQGFGGATGAHMIVNSMAWSRREVVALPDKQTTSVGPDEQVDDAGNCLGTLPFCLHFVSVDIDRTVSYISDCFNYSNNFLTFFIFPCTF